MPRVSKKVVVEPVTVRRGVTPAFVAALFFGGIIVVGGAIMLGKSDSGQINVADTINQSNQAKIESGDTSGQVSVPSQAFQNMPNGGLVPAEQQPESAPVVEENPATSTTTDETASSTSPEGEAVAGEEASSGENTTEQEVTPAQ